MATPDTQADHPTHLTRSHIEASTIEFVPQRLHVKLVIYSNYVLGKPLRHQATAIWTSNPPLQSGYVSTRNLHLNQANEIQMDHMPIEMATGQDTTTTVAGEPPTLPQWNAIRCLST